MEKVHLESYCEEFSNILSNRSIDTYFQPIVSLKNGEFIGYEALTRGPKESPLHFPDRLFGCAKRLNKIWELDLLCRITAIEKAKAIVGDKYLFINIDPDIIKDAEFKKGFTKEYLRSHGISPKHIIFEITEHTAISDYKGFKEVIDNYRTQGYRIAIDDVGDGYSGLRMLSETRPNFIKIDMELIRNIDKDMLKRELLKCIQKFAESTNIKIIAEGIESYDELKTLIDIGVEFGQGYFVQRPSPEFIEINPAVRDFIISINNTKKMIVKAGSELRVGEICRLDTPINIMEKCHKVNEIFNRNGNLHGIAVVDDNKAVGIIMRGKFYSRANEEGNSVNFYNSAINEVMDNNPLIANAEELLTDICRRAISRDEEKVYDYIIVKEKECYRGVMPFAGLLDSLLFVVA